MNAPIKIDHPRPPLPRAAYCDAAGVYRYFSAEQVQTYADIAIDPWRTRAVPAEGWIERLSELLEEHAAKNSAMSAAAVMGHANLRLHPPAPRREVSDEEEFDHRPAPVLSEADKTSLISAHLGHAATGHQTRVGMALADAVEEAVLAKLTASGPKAFRLISPIGIVSLTQFGTYAQNMASAFGHSAEPLFPIPGVKD